MAQKKYVSLTRLSNFLDNIKAKYSQIGHKHTISEITDYKVDSALSSTSTNPVQNKILDAEFDSVATAMNALEDAIDKKSSVQLDGDLLSTLNIHKLTQEEYEQMLASGSLDETTLYLTPDETTDLSGYATKEDLAEKANVSHTHDNIYYTEVEVDTLLSNKSDANHNHDSAYDAKGAADDALEAAKTYTNTKTSSLASTSAVDTKIGTHNTSSVAHSDIRSLITTLTTRLNALADSDDTTLDQLSEIVAYIKSNRTLIESITTSKINVSDIVNNLTTNSTSKVLSSAQGVVIKGLIDALQEELDSHAHSIADITGLQSALDGKADSSHGTHVSYSDTKPVMDGTASAGTANTVARSDHKHPTDTTRVSMTAFSGHTNNTILHITSSERTKWNSAYDLANTANSAAVTAQATADGKAAVQIITWGDDD